MILRRIWIIFFLAGLLSGCKTMPVRTCEMTTYEGHFIATGKENPEKYLDCRSSDLVDEAYFPYIVKNLKKFNAALLKKYKNSENIRAALKKQAAYDKFEREHNSPGQYKPRVASILEDNLSNLLRWKFVGTDKNDERKGIAIYNLYGWLEGCTYDKRRHEVCLSDAVLEQLPRDPKPSFKVIESLTPETAGMYAVVIPICHKDIIGWVISYYKF